jgi:hypothetical protein
VRGQVAQFCVLAALFGGAAPSAHGQTLDFGPPVARYRLPSVDLTNKLNQRVSFAGFSDRKLTFGHALSALAQRYGLVFEVDVEAFGEVVFAEKGIIEHPVALTPIPKMQNVPLATVLRAVLARIPSTSAATFVVRPEAIEITTRRRAAIQGWVGIRYLVEDYAQYPVCSDLTDFSFCARRLFRLLSEVGYWHGVMTRNAKAVNVEVKARPSR